MNQKELSRWLQGVVIAAAVCCLLLAAVIVPAVGLRAAERYPRDAWIFWPCLVFFWVTELPVLWALGLAWGIFRRIGEDRSFSLENAAALRKISRLALLDTALYVAAAVALVCLGFRTALLLLVFLGVVFVGVSLSVASAALSHLTQKAARLKDENDLTI